MYIKEQDRAALDELFTEKMMHPVQLIVFTKKDAGEGDEACPYCRQTVELLTEVAALSDLIRLEVYDIDADKDRAAEYGVDHVPAIAFVGEKDYGVRYYGIPAGYEFSLLIDDIVDVSRGSTSLSAGSIERLKRIDAPVHIQVFVTPTCPYCPPAARLAHQMAIENEFITADVVEAQEFPEWASRFDVFGVPRTVVNETSHFEGALPEEAAVLQVLLAADKLSPQEVEEYGLIVG